MGSSIVTESVEVAWARTRTLLLAEPEAARWLKYGFIAFLGAAAYVGGGGMNVQVPMGSGEGDGGDWSGPGAAGPEIADAFMRAIEWLGANIAHLILLTIGLVTIWLVLWLAWLYVRSVFRFIFVEAVAAPREPLIGESWVRHSGQGLSLLLWNLLLALVPLLLVIIALIPVLSSIGLIASGEPLGAVLGIGGMIGLLGLVLVAALLAMIGRALTDDFLVPAMYARGCGVFAGWRHVGRAWRGQLGNVIFFYLLKIVFAIGAAIVVGVAGLFALLLLVIPAVSIAGVVGLISLSGVGTQAALTAFGGPMVVAVIFGGAVLWYLMSVLLLPVSVLLQSYSLAFVGRLDPSLRTI